MKKIKLFLSLGILFMGGLTNAQVIYSDDFNGTFGNWTLFNVDNRTPNTNVGAINDAWVALAGGRGGSADTAAFSTSWYTPAGAADDYMFSPAITLTSNNYLFWDAAALNSNFPDGYEVRISTSTPTVANALANPALFTIAGENASWTRRAVDLSAYAGQTVHLAWRNNSNDMFVLAVDNILVQEVYTDNVSLTSLDMEDIYTVNDVVTVAGAIANVGRNSVTSVEVNWSTDGGVTVNTDTLSVNIPAFGATTFSHDITITAANPGSATDVLVWTTDPNNNPDLYNDGDTLATSFYVNNGTTVSRNVLLEEFTTSVCQFCPDGAYTMELILNANPTIIGAGIHAGFGTDSMTIPEHETYATAFTSGAPAAMVDRIKYDTEAEVAFSNRSQWNSRSVTRSNVGSAVDVMIGGTYNAVTRQASIDIDANFVDYVVPGDLRVTLFVIEDSVSKTGPAGTYFQGWDQVNAYYGTAGHPYYQVGIPTSTAGVSVIQGYQHRHVVRDVFPSTDAWGDNTVIPTNPALNTPYSTNYTFTLPANWKTKDVSLAAFVSYYDADVNKRQILNAVDIDLDLITGIGEKKANRTEFNLYPNPTAQEATMTFNLKENTNVEVTVLDITGKLMMRENLGTMVQGNQRIELNVSDLAKGIYLVNLTANGTVTSKKLSVIK
jgi:copper chaperone CopZ